MLTTLSTKFTLYLLVITSINSSVFQSTFIATYFIILVYITILLDLVYTTILLAL
jgi:hypothetical protein